MRKFECKYCKKNCILTVEEHDMKLRLCPYSSFPLYANWHEVEDSAENAHTTNVQFGNSEQLPDWVKVGECMYLPEKGKYFKITEDFMNVNLIGEKLTDILSGKIVQARKRPFNADEMKALVGKILTHKQTGDLTLVTDFINEYDKDLDYHYSTVFAFGENYTDGDLMDDCTIDGKPCYVLEHLENGEWVE